jgi:hypothetical protein
MIYDGINITNYRGSYHKMSVTLTMEQFNKLLKAAGGADKHVDKPVKHHHRVVEEVWTSESDDSSEEVVVAPKKKNVAKATKAAKGKKVADVTADGHVMKKVDESDIACYCPTRHGDECEATVRYRIKGGEFPYVCAAHAKILREGGHIGPKPKKERDICRATTKKGHTCKNYASEDSYYCHLHDEDDE